MKRSYESFGRLLAGLLMVLYGSGCLITPKLPQTAAARSNLTPGMVKAAIQVGTTTQTDVITVFGSPNTITRDRSGQEVWTYDVQSVSHASASSASSGHVRAGGFGMFMGTTPAAVGGGGSHSRQAAVSEVSSSTFVLMVTFDADERVADYRMMSTKF